MKLHIMGAGAMGCLWAAHLHYSANQHDIAFIDGRISPGDATSPRVNFSVSSPFLAHIPNSETLSFERCAPNNMEPINYLLVCTKSFDTLSGLRQIRSAISQKTIIVLFQNGLGSQYDIVEAFPSNPIYAAVTTEGVNKHSSQRIIHAGKGVTLIGPLSDAAKLATHSQALIHQLQTNSADNTIDTLYVEDIWQALWHKLIVNCAINPYTALLNCPNGEVRRSARFIQDWPSLRRELFDLLTAAGYPLDIEVIEQRVFSVMESTQENISSMLQDIRAGRRTEVTDINGFAARFLERHKLNNRINKSLELDVFQISNPVKSI